MLTALLAATPGAHARAADGPANTAPPTLPGTVKVNGTVTANPGAWTSSNSSSISFAYQWLGCDAQGAACHLIPYSGQTIAGLQAPVGTTIRVTVTATDSTGSATATSAPAKVVSASGSPGPSGAKAPSITLVSPKPSSTVHAQAITFVVRIRSTSRSVEVNLDNEQDVKGPPGLFRLTVRVNDPGRVRFLVEATSDNGDGKTASRA
jgi:hypothetical protein